MRRVVFVFFKGFGDKGGDGGKLTPELYLPVFEETLKPFGIPVTLIPDEEWMEAPGRFRGHIVILVYKETAALARRDFSMRVRVVERIARTHWNDVLQPHALGMLVADKLRTSRALAECGVPVPRVASTDRAEFPVFSNEIASSHAGVRVHQAGDRLDTRRFNTEYIDTLHTFRGKRFHVAVRAMCVGRSCVEILVRARPESEGDPSVHNADTPLDPDLLNFLYESIVVPRRDTITEICRAIGDRLGLGFYAHDILPCASSGRLYVCETGFKFDDMSFHGILGSLQGRVSFIDRAAAAARSAAAFVAEARELGLLR